MNNLKPIKFACITPIHLLNLIPKEYNFHLLLAHLLDSREYVDFYKQRKALGDTIVLDNSAFEFGRPLEADEILQMISKSGITPDYVVAPDYPKMNWKKTVDSSLNFANQARGESFKVMAVPQGEVGDHEGWLEGYRALVKHPDINMIGMSILAIPNAFQKVTGTSDIMVNRLFATSHILTNKLQISHYTNETGFGPMLPVTKWHHYLGLGQPREILLQRGLGLMDSNDSSSPVWHGVQGIKYDSSYGALKDGKSPIPVDFHITKFDHAIDQIAKCITFNLKQIDNFATKDCSAVDITSIDNLKNFMQETPVEYTEDAHNVGLGLAQASYIANAVKGSVQRSKLVEKAVEPIESSYTLTTRKIGEIDPTKLPIEE